MKEDKYFEEKISRALEAIKHPENFTDEELRKLLNDTKCLQACRDLLDGKEALARQNATAPDIEKEWSKFSSQHTTQKDIRHKGELNSPDGAPKGKTRNIDTFGRKLSVPAVKRMRFIGLSIVLIAASIALLFWLYAPAHSYYTVFEARTVAQEISIHTHEGKNLLTVPRGMNNQITLTDGTRIWLNAESQLEYPENFEGQEKRVVRLKGEAKRHRSSFYRKNRFTGNTSLGNFFQYTGLLAGQRPCYSIGRQHKSKRYASHERIAHQTGTKCHIAKRRNLFHS